MKTTSVPNGATPRQIKKHRWYSSLIEFFLPVLEEISFRSPMWITAVDLPLKRREALCLAVSEGALPNIQMVSLCSLLLCCFAFDNCEGKGGKSRGLTKLQ